MDDPEEERLTRARARVGSVLRGKWRIDRLLGAGGMATVFAATHRNGMRVAVKMLHPELSMVGEARRRFVNEGYAANRIEHPGAVKVLDDDVDDDGAAFLVMELLEGETLEARRERAGGRLPPADVLALAAQALDVLTAAHDKGVIHRDLKPENLFLTREGKLKLVDFGLARLQELSGDARLTASSGGIMGTPAFLPPEQARGRWADIDGRTDLWALGATMFTLLSGRCVHEAETLNEVLVAAITRPAPPLASVVVGAPAALSRVVDKALAMDPRDRYQNARAMAEAVQRALAEIPAGPDEAISLAPTLVAARSSPLGVSSETATPRGPDAVRTRRRLGLLAVIVAGLAAILATRLLSSAQPRSAITGEAKDALSSASAAPAALAAPIVVVAASAAPTGTVAASAASAAAPPAPATPRGKTAPRPSAAAKTDEVLDRRN